MIPRAQSRGPASAENVDQHQLISLTLTLFSPSSLPTNLEIFRGRGEDLASPKVIQLSRTGTDV